MFGDNPPRGLRWANTAVARAITTMVAIVALTMSIVLLGRLQDYTKCIADQQAISDERSRAIAAATDIERAADTALIAGATPGGPTAEELAQASVAARAVTDRVRAQNPPPPLRRC